MDRPGETFNASAPSAADGSRNNSLGSVKSLEDELPSSGEAAKAPAAHLSLKKRMLIMAA